MLRHWWNVDSLVFHWWNVDSLVFLENQNLPIFLLFDAQGRKNVFMIHSIVKVGKMLFP